MSLIQRRDYEMQSGGVAAYHIDCSALTGQSLDTLAWLVASNGDFCAVEAASPRGQRFAGALERYRSEAGVRLIVDDVLTSGSSMEAARARLGWHDAVGVVLFARVPCPALILPLFTMQWINTRDRSGFGVQPA
jgi:hypothetical protein